MKAQEQRDLDVEIGFLEGLVRRDENWVDALKLLADDYTQRGRVKDGLRVDERLMKLCPEDALVYYNLACSYSLSEQLPLAFETLEKAVMLGYADFRWLSRDPDMANLRKHPEYRAFRAKLELIKNGAGEASDLEEP